MNVVVLLLPLGAPHAWFLDYFIPRNCTLGSLLPKCSSPSLWGWGCLPRCKLRHSFKEMRVPLEQHLLRSFLVRSTVVQM